MSAVVGADSMGWRYDPIFTGKIHSVEWHISEFEKMAEILAGYTKTCVISFIDIYKKVERNFPEAKSVRIGDRYRCLAGFGYRMLTEAIKADLPYHISCPALLICGEKDKAGSTKSYNKKWHHLIYTIAGFNSTFISYL